MGIPKIVHQLWLQRGELPSPLNAYTGGVRETCRSKGWDYRLWDAYQVAQLPGTSGEMFRLLSPKCDTISQQSNLARYLILLEIGGLYLDTDVEVYDLPESIEGAWVARNPFGRLAGSYFLACPPRHSWIERVVSMLETLDLGVRGSAGSSLVAASLGNDVSLWPFNLWGVAGRAPAIYGVHHWLGVGMGHFNIPPVIVE